MKTLTMALTVVFVCGLTVPATAKRCAKGYVLEDESCVRLLVRPYSDSAPVPDPSARIARPVEPQAIQPGPVSPFRVPVQPTFGSPELNPFGANNPFNNPRR